jgi:N-acetylglutamate synthase-like GNAT family acetyltransferase
MSGAGIVSAAAGDLDALRRLLALAELPEAGFLDHFPAAYAVARRGPEIVGVAGLETHGRVGLLRSVAVAPGLRGHGIGRALVADRIRAARSGALEAIYLLTTTAAGYFQAAGFVPAPREDAPAELATSPEFAGACPASAACLVLRL